MNEKDPSKIYGTIYEDQSYKFAFEITPEQRARADKLLSQYGVRRAIFSNILDDVLDVLEEFGGAALGLMMAGRVKPREILPTIIDAVKED
jgi:hypothetical protein